MKLRPIFILTMVCAVLTGTTTAFGGDGPEIVEPASRPADRAATVQPRASKFEMKLALQDTAVETAIRNVAQASAATNDLGKSDWNRRIMETQEKRNKGKRYFLYGVGIGAGATVLAIVGGPDPGDANPGSGVTTLAALAATGGGALAVYGGYKWFSAEGDLKDLDREGRSKGYLTLLPVNRGIGVRFAFNLR